MGLTRLQPGACCGCNTFSSCGGCGLNAAYPTLFVTDSSSTVACPALGSGWRGCYLMTVGSAATPCVCQNGGTFAAACTGIIYDIQCDPNSTNKILVQRTWFLCELPGGGVCGYCCPDAFDSSCNTVLNACPPGQAGPGCSAPDYDIGTAVISSCTPFPLSVTLNLATWHCFSGSTVLSPLGSGVTINH